MDTTALLKASINHERNKLERGGKDLTNLTNHSEKTLQLMVESVEFKMRDCMDEIQIKESILEQSEDLTTRLRSNLTESIVSLKDKVQSLIALRVVLFMAIEKVKG